MSRQGTAQERTLENVKAFWDREAHECGQSPQVTIRDHYMRLLSLETIREQITGRRRALDIGCGTGFSTLFYAQVVEQIMGADYSEEMIRWARRLLSDPAHFRGTVSAYVPDGGLTLSDNVQFEVGNIVSLQYPDASFDAVVTERVLVNLPQRSLQDQAIREVARVLNPGGRWVVAEASWEGHGGVDRLRTVAGLPLLEKYWHNLYLEEPVFEASLQAAGFRIEAIHRFETYHFLSKVVHPLVVAPEEPAFLSTFNRAAWHVSRAAPTYAAVREGGLEPFFRETVPAALAAHAPDYVPAYRRVAEALWAGRPIDFTGCSHHVLYVLHKERAKVSASEPLARH